jgi:PPOX class probable F420-dependent enzyme
MGLVLPESARAVILSDRVAQVVTLGAEGSPHVSCAWVGLDGDEVVFGTLPDQRKLHNIRRDPRIALSIVTNDTNPFGLTEYLVLYGRARVTEGGALELLQELARTYLGEGVKFPPMDVPPPGFVTRIEVERLGGVGPWTQR